MDSQPELDSEGEDVIVKTIIFNELSIPAFQEIEVATKTYLRFEAERSTMDIQECGYVYGNPRGHTLIEEIQDMKRLVHQIPRMREEIEHNGKEVASLQGQVELFTRNSDCYLAIRERFLDVYQRDIGGLDAFKGCTTIREGSSKAHRGDAIADATLFDTGKRSDPELFQELYGLGFKEVLELNDSPSNDGAVLLVLNEHATILAEPEPLSNDLRTAFHKFICQVRGNWLKSPREEATTPFGKSYYNFWSISKKFIRSRGQQLAGERESKGHLKGSQSN